MRKRRNGEETKAADRTIRKKRQRGGANEQLDGTSVLWGQHFCLSRGSHSVNSGSSSTSSALEEKKEKERRKRRSLKRTGRRGRNTQRKYVNDGKTEFLMILPGGKKKRNVR